MRRCCIGLSVAAALTLTRVAELRAQTLACRGASAKATALREYVQNIVSGTRSSSGTVRSLLGISPMDTAAVKLVTADSICTRVTYAADAVFNRPRSNAALLVVKFGSRYGAYDPDVVWNGPSMMSVLDSAFVYLKTITAF